MANFSKMLLALICLMSLTLFPSCSAQNSIKDYLDAHNAARAQVSVGPMRWDNQLATYALNYANKQKVSCSKLKHSGGPYGENIAAGSGGGGFTARRAMGLWVAEKRYYDYQSNSCKGGVCGHYTQVVWRKSNRLGCARVKCLDNSWWFVICSYAPAGNVVGQRPY